MSRFPPFALRLAFVLSATAEYTLPAHAADPPLAVGAVAGYGDRSNVYGVQVALMPRFCGELLERHDLDLRIAGQVTRWLARDERYGHRALTDGSITSELRYRPSPGAPGRPFVEVGLGVHVISHLQIGKRNLGAALDFGTHIATGFIFGENGRYELAALISHVSNGSIKYPNDGFTYGSIRFRVALP